MSAVSVEARSRQGLPNIGAGFVLGEGKGGDELQYLQRIHGIHIIVAVDVPEEVRVTGWGGGG